MDECNRNLSEAASKKIPIETLGKVMILMSLILLTSTVYYNKKQKGGNLRSTRSYQ